ncbi:hypothetical protein CPC08DRAFT_678969 [Agrocybe pediades]|nr:hypothetical protein CPC08DRAFT_678969 [Agrocybe pediades]
MSFLSRLWNAVRRPVKYVGRDLEGNIFYEAPSPNDPSRPKRTVEYYGPEAVWKYVGGGKRLPIQWSAWLTHTRKHPPTLQELQMDLERQQRVLANAAMIEARDRAEAEEMLRIRQRDAAQALEEATTRALGSSQVHQRTHPESTTQTASQAEPASSGDASEPSRTTKTKFQPPKFLTPATPRNPKSTANETESWTPKARQRG